MRSPIEALKVEVQMAEDGNDSESFPGLNKTHGFFKAIERNQRDRDSYHHRTEVRNLKNMHNFPRGDLDTLQLIRSLCFCLL